MGVGGADNSLYGKAVRDSNSFEHYGVKGMHWGIRRNRDATSATPTPVRVAVKPGRAVKTAGGQHHPPHADAVNAAVLRQKARKSSTDSLSTRELQDLVLRLNMEQQYRTIIAKDPHSKSDVQKFLDTTLKVGKTANQVHTFMNSPAGKALKLALKAKLGK